MAARQYRFSSQATKAYGSGLLRLLAEDMIKPHFFNEKKISRENFEKYLWNNPVTFGFLIVALEKEMVSPDFLHKYIVNKKLNAIEVMDLINYDKLARKTVTELYVTYPDFFSPLQIKALKKKELIKPLNISCVYQIMDDGSGNSVGNGDGAIKPGEAVDLHITVKNLNDFPIKNVKIFITPSNMKGVRLFNKKVLLGDLSPGDIKHARFTFSIKKYIKLKELSLNFKLSEKHFLTVYDKDLKIPINTPIAPQMITN